MRANKGRIQKFIAKVCTAKNFITSARGRARIEIAIKQQQNQQSLKSWNRNESDVAILLMGNSF